MTIHERVEFCGFPIPFASKEAKAGDTFEVKKELDWAKNNEKTTFYITSEDTLNVVIEPSGPAAQLMNYTPSKLLLGWSAINDSKDMVTIKDYGLGFAKRLHWSDSKKPLL